MTDWEKIKYDYITGSDSYRMLAEKYGVSIDAIKRKAAAQGWTAERTKTTAEIHQNALAKVVERTSDLEADRVTTLMRIGEKAARFLEKRLDVLIAVGAKAYEVKAIMETVKLIREVYDSGPRTAEDDPLLAYLERLKNDG